MWGVGRRSCSSLRWARTRKTAKNQGEDIHGPVSIGLPLPALPHLLKFSETLKIAPWACDQCSSIWTLLGHVQILIGSKQGRPSWWRKERWWEISPPASWGQISSFLFSSFLSGSVPRILRLKCASEAALCKSGARDQCWRGSPVVERSVGVTGPQQRNLSGYRKQW